MCTQGNYGENLYAAWGSGNSIYGIDCDAATQAWYDEIVSAPGSLLAWGCADSGANIPGKANDA